MENKEEASYWLKMSDKKYSEAMDMLEVSDSYYEKAMRIMKTKRKEE